jgi:hypothetical protein
VTFFDPYFMSLLTPLPPKQLQQHREELFWLPQKLSVPS